MPKNNYKEMVSSLNTHKEYPALNIVKDDPTIAAVISKLIKSRDTTNKLNIRDPKTFTDIGAVDFESMSSTISSRINDVGYVKDLFPDIELAEQILISSILSPKDMMSTNVIYKLEESIMSPELTSRVIDEIRDYIEKNYKISDILPDILLETLFESGAYVKAVLPESSVDELINYNSNSIISTESLVSRKLFTSNLNVSNVGLLGTPFEKTRRYGIESMMYKGNYDPYIRLEDGSSLPNSYSTLVEITDNINILKLPKILEHNSKANIRKVYSKESMFDNKPDPEKGYTNDDITSMLYKDNVASTDPFVYVNNKSQTKRKSIGKPLLLKLPTESVIPVHIPGDPTSHIGYFVLLDEDGNPLSNLDNKDYLEGLTDAANGNNSLSSFLLQKAKRNLIGNDKARHDNIEQQARIYTNIVEADLIDRLKKGMYNRKLAIVKVEEIYRIMLARSLANRQTKLLFMPVEVVSYFANDYLPNGIGKSLMDNMKILTSLRAILLFAKVMAMAKNSISRTKVNVTLDPDDPDPQKTMEETIHEVVKMRQQYFPLGINSPVDLVDWLQRAGLEFAFEGHPGLPETKLDFDQGGGDTLVPDSEFDETLRKWTFMAMGLSPEMVDRGFDTEFATTAVINNLLLSKRVLQIQKRFTKQLSEFIRKILSNDSYIQNMILTIFRENKNSLLKHASDDDKELFEENQNAFYVNYYSTLIDNINLELPKPDASALEVQSNEFDLYAESLEKGLDAVINTEFMTSDTHGNISNYLDEIKSAFKNYFLRDWMAKNNYLPELADITSMDEDGKPILNLFDIYKDHNQALVSSTIGFVQNMAPQKRKVDKMIEKAEEEPPEEEENNEYGSYSSVDTNTEPEPEPSEEDNNEGEGNEEESNESSDDDLGLDLSDLGI